MIKKNLYKTSKHFNKNSYSVEKKYVWLQQLLAVLMQCATLNTCSSYNYKS